MFYSIFLTSHARTCNINHRYSEVQQYSLHSREGTEQDSDSIHVLIVLKAGLLYEHSSPIIISSLPAQSSKFTRTVQSTLLSDFGGEYTT